VEIQSGIHRSNNVTENIEKFAENVHVRHRQSTHR